MMFDTALDESGLLTRQVMDDASSKAVAYCYDKDSSADWWDDIREEFYLAYNDGRPDAAAALAHAAQMYAHNPQTRFDLLYLQGVALTAMIKAGGPVDLHDFRIAAFENALQALPGDHGWTHPISLCRIHLARAWHDAGQVRADADMIRSACDEYAAILPQLRSGRLGFWQHAKAAEIAALRAHAAETSARLGADADPLPHWLLALTLALDPKLREEDTLGYWDASMDLLEPWISALASQPNLREARADARNALQALALKPDNPDYAWVQYYIGALALSAGLQAEGMRMGATSTDHEDELVASIDAYRKALSEIEAGNGTGWTSTVFHLAYALHALGEARRDLRSLGEAIELYERVATRLVETGEEENRLELAQVRMNLSEAMAQKGDIDQDEPLIHRAATIADAALATFSDAEHDEGIAAAKANRDFIAAIIEQIDKP